MLKRVVDLVRDEEGATMVEYALVVAAIALIVCVGAEALGGAISDAFASIGDTVTAATP